MSARPQAHRAVVRPLDLPLVDDERWTGWAQAVTAGVILALVFLVVIPAAGLVICTALGLDPMAGVR